MVLDDPRERVKRPQRSHRDPQVENRCSNTFCDVLDLCHPISWPPQHVAADHLPCVELNFPVLFKFSYLKFKQTHVTHEYSFGKVSSTAVVFKLECMSESSREVAKTLTEGLTPGI